MTPINRVYPYLLFPPLRNAITSSSVCNIPTTCAIIKPIKEEPSTSASVRLISEILKVKFA